MNKTSCLIVSLAALAMMTHFYLVVGYEWSRRCFMYQDIEEYCKRCNTPFCDGYIKRNYSAALAQIVSDGLKKQAEKWMDEDLCTYEYDTDLGRTRRSKPSFGRQGGKGQGFGRKFKHVCTMYEDFDEYCNKCYDKLCIDFFARNFEKTAEWDVINRLGYGSIKYWKDLGNCPYHNGTVEYDVVHEVTRAPAV